MKRLLAALVSASLASSKVARTAGCASQPAIIPIDCDPCPGNTTAIVIVC